MKGYFKVWLTVLAMAWGALAMITLASQPARAAGPWYVAPGGSDGNSCTSPGAACATISGAIAKASPGDTIYVATGTYTGAGGVVVYLNKNVTLSGGWDDTFTTQSGTSTIDGEGSRRGMTVNSGVAAIVERFVVQNGWSDWVVGDGGGISNSGTLTLNSSTVNGNMTVSAFIDGGGIYNVGTMVLNNSIVNGNMARDGTGGGIYSSYGTMTFNNSTVSDNMSGGIYFNEGTVTLNNSTVSGNMGGGIRNSGGTLTLNNSTISDNTANSGGGINQNGGTVSLNNCTVNGNTANVSGGGISKGGGTMTLQNTILADNTSRFGVSPDCSGEIGSLGYNLIGDTSGCAFTPGTGDLTDVGANLGQLIGAPGAPRYHPLLAGSPAIDAGNPTGCTDHLGNPLDTDQRGAARVGTCDIGAYEYTTPGPAASIYAFGGTPQTTPPSFAFWMPLQAAVLDSIGSPVNNATVTFSAPASGAGGTFADSGTFTTIAVTAESGVATAATFTANGLEGSYTVTATVSGVVTPANFLLGNIVWYVAPGGNDGNDCQTPATTCATINGTLSKAGFTAGDTVLVSIGTYTGTGDEVVLLDKSVRLLGGWNGTFSTQSGLSAIDGEGTRRGITLESGVTAIVDCFDIQNGSADTGGGIQNDGTLTLNNSAVSGSTAVNWGGGICNYGDLILIDSTVSGNSTGYRGGGIENRGTMTLKSSAVSGNTGGGILNDGTAILNGSIVSGNTGGGINGGFLTLNSSSVSGNTGGGINAGLSLMTLNNSTISGNTAAVYGGGINNYGSTITLNNTTVSNNVAQYAGGIYNNSGQVTSAIVTLRNSILAGNTGGDCIGIIGTSGYNLIGDTSSCLGFTPGTGDLTNIDAKLGPLEGSPGYHPLFPGSPAINAGNPAGCTDHLDDPLPFDQRGMPRMGRCDIGAYEVSLTATKQADGTYTPGTSLTYIITLRNDVDSDITGVFITDTLPISLTYVPGSFSATNGTGGESGGVITWNGTVPAGSSTTISFRATIGDDVPSCSFITNKALISGGAGYGFEREVMGTTPCVCNLTKHAGNPVLSVGADGTWDDDGVWGPAVLKEGSSYRMWYTGDDGSGPSQIGLATSTDGVNWTKDAANPVLSPSESWEVEGIRAGSVIFDSGLYKMWYTGRDSSGVGRIGYATSPDGVTWTKDGSNPVLDVGASGSWEDDGVSGPTVIKAGGTYHIWYTGDDGITPRIGHATSSDGIHWIKDSANPVLDIGPPGDWDWLYVYDPSVVAYNDVYLLWYSGGTLPEAWQTGYALSSNGSDWTRQAMLIPEGTPGTFDVNSADYPSVIVDGTGFKVWYSGLNDGGTYNIGYATAEICEPGAAPPANPVYLPIVMKGGGACPPYYTDNFSDPDSGWPIGDNSNFTFGYISNQYQIRLKNPPGGFQVTPGAKATDFAAAISARRTSGTYGAYGIHFGINEDWSEYYEVVIDAHYYSIWRYDGTWTPLRDWTTSGYINTGTSWNRLKVIRDGANIAVYVNNHHLATVTDSSFTGLRRIGLYAGSYRAFDARFDDFSLYLASCGVDAAGVGFEIGEPGVHGGPMPPGLDQSP